MNIHEREHFSSDETGMRFKKDVEEIEISKEAIAEYIKGCSEIALGLNTASENILKDSKKPIILIPSRGAIPVFLLAQDVLRTLDPANALIDPRKVSYYPRRVFEFLSENRVNMTNNPNRTVLENPKKSKVDVVLYPCTCDVSTEPEISEWLAKKLRGSCTRVFSNLIFKTEDSLDLNWHSFLMSKIHPDSFRDTRLNPIEIDKALRDYGGAKNGQMVLVDTVISGRAAEDIVTSFASSGHKVTSILAVDTRGGDHFQPKRKANIEQNIAWEYIGDQDPFKAFPLITEDKGAALLGLTAMNFSNFNKSGFFNQVDPRFEEDFLPQSCLYTLPPGHQRYEYVKSFRNFMDLCSKMIKGEDLGDLSEFLGKIGPLIKTPHKEMDERDIKGLVKTEGKVTARETSSHIICVTLPDRAAKAWVREFSDTFFKTAA
ncbi:hypothetical protein M1349_04295 [Patescibacteria group bacterium]|nr:hypothetical protein [Patescibacteria group bacterium]